jgi:hypothetical protein
MHPLVPKPKTAAIDQALDSSTFGPNNVPIIVPINQVGRGSEARAPRALAAFAAHHYSASLMNIPV